MEEQVVINGSRKGNFLVLTKGTERRYLHRSTWSALADDMAWEDLFEYALPAKHIAELVAEEKWRGDRD